MLLPSAVYRRLAHAKDVTLNTAGLGTVPRLRGVPTFCARDSSCVIEKAMMIGINRPANITTGMYSQTGHILHPHTASLQSCSDGLVLPNTNDIFLAPIKGGR